MRGVLTVPLHSSRRSFTSPSGRNTPCVYARSEALSGLGIAVLWQGRYDEARDHYAEGLSRHDPIAHRDHVFDYGQDPAVTMRSLSAIALLALGERDAASIARARAVTRARNLGHPYSLAMALVFAAMVHQLCGEPAGCKELANEACQLASGHGFPLWHAMSTVLGGWARTRETRDATGIEAMRRGVRAWSATGARWGSGYFVALQADGLRGCDHTNGARVALAEARTRAHRAGETFTMPFVGNIAAALG